MKSATARPVKHRSSEQYTTISSSFRRSFNASFLLGTRVDPFASLTLQAWDDDLAPILGAADKQWDLSPSVALDATVTFDILKGVSGLDGFVSGEGSDGDEGSCGGLTPDPNACRDAFLIFRIDPIRQPRINTLFVDSRDVDDLVTTDTGVLRYLGDQAFYVAWLEVTIPRDPFVVGLNAVIVPRPQFLNSSVNHTLQATEDANDLPAHLKPLTFTSLDDTSGETTNAIVGVLNGTLTGDQALALLDDLRRGPDGTVNGNVTVVTGDLVTLGLADNLVNSIPLTGVRFDATGRGPGDFFDPLRDFITAFLNAVTFVVQGLVLIGNAIAQFFQQAAQFLVDLGMKVVGAISAFLGAVASAVEKVGEALASLLKFLIDWAVSLLISGLVGVANSLKDALAVTVAQARNAAAAVWNDFQARGEVSKGAATDLRNSLFSPTLIVPLGVLSAAVVVAVAVVGAALLPFGFLLAVVAGLAILAIMSAIAGEGIALRAPPIPPPSSFELSPSGLLHSSRSYVDATEAAQGTGSHLADVWLAVAGALDVLATALTVIFLVGNVDRTGIGSLIIGLTFSIFATIVTAELLASVSADQRGPIEWIIGITLIMIAILVLFVTGAGLLKALLIDPTGVKYVPIALMSIIAALGAIFFSLRALDIVP